MSAESAATIAARATAVRVTAARVDTVRDRREATIRDRAALPDPRVREDLPEHLRKEEPTDASAEES